MKGLFRASIVFVLSLPTLFVLVLAGMFFVIGAIVLINDFPLPPHPIPAFWGIMIVAYMLIGIAAFYQWAVKALSKTIGLLPRY